MLAQCRNCISVISVPNSGLFGLWCERVRSRPYLRVLLAGLSAVRGSLYLEIDIDGLNAMRNKGIAQMPDSLPMPDSYGWAVAMKGLNGCDVVVHL